MGSPGRLYRAITFVLPVLSVIVAALVFLGPGALAPAAAARVRGAPAEGARTLSLRIEAVRAYHDVIDALEARELLVEATAPGQSLAPFRGDAGPDGIADAVLTAPAPLRGPVALTISAKGPRGRRVLAYGTLPLRRAAPAFVQLGTLAGHTRGDLAIRVDAVRGIFASPFPEKVRIWVSLIPDAPLGGRADLVLSGAGLRITPERVTTDEQGRAEVHVEALAHNVELAIDAKIAGRKARWEGTLPVVPGAIWIDPASRPGTLTLVSPSPRPRAYLSLWSEEGRVLGASVPLARDGLGFFRGEVQAAIPPSAITYAVVAGDALEQGSGTVAWPLRPAEGAVAASPKLALLLDGVPAALGREKERAWSARRTGLILIGIAAFAEVLLLLAQSRAAQRRLDAHFADSAAALPEEDRRRLLGATRERPVLRVLLLISLTALGFALIAALSTFR
jgi:hypothetical protein